MNVNLVQKFRKRQSEKQAALDVLPNRRKAAICFLLYV
jgi:hypothetical protein